MADNTGGNRNAILGGWGESIAARYLRDKGYKILAAGYRCRFGELDIIAQKDCIIVFVEVKTRSSSTYMRPALAVTPAKLKKMKSTAELFLQRENISLASRFDIVEIIANKDLSFPPREINHMEDIYRPGY